MEEELKLLGLNDVDIKVYLSLLKIGQGSASQIAIKSGVPRASIYDVLERLEKEGLVSYIIKESIKYFSAAEPKAIIKSLDYKKERLKDIIPQLESFRHKELETTMKTEIYGGIKGLQTILNMILDSKEIFVIGASRKSLQVLPYFMEKWHRERIRKKIAVTIIYNDLPDVRESMEKEETRKLLGVPKYWKHKFLNINYSSPLMTIVFSDYVALVMWRKDLPSAVLIHSKDIAGTYKQYILNLWSSAKR